MIGPIVSTIARSLSLRPEQVETVLALSDEGATIPFLARYRKEATGGLDEVQLQDILELSAQLKALESRREAILRSVEEQGLLTPELEAQLRAADSRTVLEDLYLPYKPKRRTRAQMARERGLEPLAELIWQQAEVPDSDARVASFVSAERDVPDAAAALAGARDICAERIAEDASLRQEVRQLCQTRATWSTTIAKAHRDTTTRFDAYREHSEPLSRAPSHRVLAMLRGEAEGVLKLKVGLPDDEATRVITTRIVTRPRATLAGELKAACEDSWARLLKPSLESELRSDAKARADREATVIFGQNLRHLLLAPPAGTRKVIALDPGLRTGVKLAALDATGKVLATTTLYTERGAAERAKASEVLLTLIQKMQPELIAVGNGTGSREAEAFVREVLTKSGQVLPVVQVSEQGASIYSASPIARAEFPDLDVSLRGAISIGRRLQDPLAELVKIDPKSIGVGQYQHDIEPGLLQKRLGDVVDSCVNAVGVDVNTASPELLAHVSGLGPKLAKKVVEHREKNGPFISRKALLKVSGLGKKTYEQAAGFLRVRGEEPLDASAVHPERYEVVHRMAQDVGVPVKELMGSAERVRRIDLSRYVAEDLGLPTLKDILAELEKPSRDPRGDFTAPEQRDDLRTLEDVQEGMVLEGTVTNVAAFGAFVDIGVHQDGLVHVSQLASRFVKDPAEVVKVGDRVKVRVLSVDLARKRLALSIRAVTEGGAGRAPQGQTRSQGRSAPRASGGQGPKNPPLAAEPFNNPFAKLRR